MLLRSVVVVWKLLFNNHTAGFPLLESWKSYGILNSHFTGLYKVMEMYTCIRSFGKVMEFYPHSN